MMINEIFKGVDILKVELEQGYRLFAFTDGLSETQNSDGILFGEERLSHIMNKSQHLTIKEVTDQFVKEA